MSSRALLLALLALGAYGSCCSGVGAQERHPAPALDFTPLGGHTAANASGSSAPAD
ncbi:MAG: hypothetical protein IAI49_09095 [Candidatus Eremiobacteraeota bacterium]|nr:hypothetical protein [Candidatus Eremiobacteraeota bacterium]